MNHTTYTSITKIVPGFNSISINGEGNPIKEPELRNFISAFIQLSWPKIKSRYAMAPNHVPTKLDLSAFEAKRIRNGCCSTKPQATSACKYLVAVNMYRLYLSDDSNLSEKNLSNQLQHTALSINNQTLVIYIGQLFVWVESYTPYWTVVLSWWRRQRHEAWTGETSQCFCSCKFKMEKSASELWILDFSVSWRIEDIWFMVLLVEGLP